MSFPSVVFLSSLAFVVAGQSCKPLDVPFNSSFIGKTFERSDSCLRSSTTTSLEIKRSVIVYYPQWNYRLAGTPYAPYCRELYVYHFRKRDMLPFIEHYPPLGMEKVVSLSSTGEVTKACKETQKPLKYSVWGPTRAKFIESIRRIVKELPVIRYQFLCVPQLEKTQRFVVDPVAKQVDVFINFFISLGCTFFFCAQ